MKSLIENKKLVIVDVETNGRYCVEEGKKPAQILRIDATKIENGKIGETFSSFVECKELLDKKTIDLTGITDDMLKGAPTTKQVLEKLKEFCSGYCVYSSNSEFDNDFLSYYGEKAGVELELPKKQYYDVISLFLHSKCGAEFYLEFLDSGYEYETVYLAEQLLKFINGDFKYL